MGDDYIGNLIKIEKQKLDLEEASIAAKIMLLQEACPHPRLSGKDEQLLDDFDKKIIQRWRTFRCPHCGKQWREDL